VIDAADQPELSDDVRAGRFLTFACEQCGRQVTRTTSLLFVSDRRSPMLFAPDPTADTRRTQEQLMASLMMAGDQSEPGEFRLPPVLPVPHEILPLAARRHVSDDLDAWRAGTWNGDSIELQRYGAWLVNVGTMQLMTDVKDAVGELTTVTDAASFADVVRRRPVLLTDEADALLRAMQEVSDAEAPMEYQREVEQWRHLLRLCRRDGVESTLGRLRDA
jgi:hypothetical protein